MKATSRTALLLPLLALLACGPEAPPPVPPTPMPSASAPPAPEPPRVTPDAPFRANAPAPAAAIQFVAPKVQEMTLKSGLRVLLVERHDLPIVSVRLVVTAGAGDVDGARPGALSFLGSMLEQGTKKRNALQVSDDYEAIGAQHNAWFDWDSGGVSIKVLADKLDAGLEIMSDVALHATLPDAEIERLRARRIAAIQAEKSSPGSAASNTLAASMFGRAHPYGHALHGGEEDAKKLQRAELARLYERIFQAQNAAIVVAGDVTKDALLPKLETAFGAWKKTGPALSHKGPTKPAKIAAGKRIVLVDRVGAQSQVNVARIGVPNGVKDREQLVVMNAILGGMFSSRINLNLREKNAYTYGARSYFTMRHGAGPFLVAGSIHAEKTVPAIKEIFTELEALRKDGPSEDELALAKESIRASMPGRFEGVSDVTNAISELVVYDLPLDDFEKRLVRYEAVTAADVKRAAADWLDPKTMTVLVVGDKKKLSAELDTLALGAFEERDPWGNIVQGDGAKAKETPKDAKPAAPKDPPAKELVKDPSPKK